MSSKILSFLLLWKYFFLYRFAVFILVLSPHLFLSLSVSFFHFLSSLFISTAPFSFSFYPFRFYFSFLRYPQLSLICLPRFETKSLASVQVPMLAFHKELIPSSEVTHSIDLFLFFIFPFPKFLLFNLFFAIIIFLYRFLSSFIVNASFGRVFKIRNWERLPTDFLMDVRIIDLLTLRCRYLKA